MVDGSTWRCPKEDNAAGPQLFGRSCWRLVAGPELRPAEIEQVPRGTGLRGLAPGDLGDDVAMCGRCFVYQIVLFEAE